MLFCVPIVKFTPSKEICNRSSGSAFSLDSGGGGGFGRTVPVESAAAVSVASRPEGSVKRMGLAAAKAQGLRVGSLAAWWSALWKKGPAGFWKRAWKS